MTLNCYSNGNPNRQQYEKCKIPQKYFLYHLYSLHGTIEKETKTCLVLISEKSIAQMVRYSIVASIHPSLSIIPKWIFLPFHGKMIDFYLTLKISKILTDVLEL